ncbi:MAG: 8-amino-7-oxononanoate synthase [Pseudomonadota bacterium]
MADPFADGIAADLAARRDAGLYRTRQIQQAPCGATARIDGRTLLNFCSNDYLGLAAHPEVAAAFRRGVDRHGCGSGASHLVAGHTQAHHALEEALAAFTGRPRALLFSTGYMANLGTIAALCSDKDAVFEDRLNHASLLDAGLLAGARFQRYLHGDVESLQARLDLNKARRRLVVTDGVFSMDGDIAPLSALARLCRDRQAWLMVDDAHGIGVCGPEGRGSVAAAGLGTEDVPVLVGTLGKALGTAGAFVAGSENLIEYLVQFARPYIYTTAMPAAVAEATLASLALAQREEWRRERLRAHIARFRAGALQLGYTLLPSETPIQPVLSGDARRAVDFSNALRDHGVLVSAIRPPTVPEGSARLRFTFSAAHEDAQVDALLAVLDTLAPRFARP